MDETTADGFLGGRLTILQPARGYRAGIDPVLLAAAVSARRGDRVLDLGCGVGVAGLCLQARVGELALSGLEIQPDLAALARRNAQANRLAFEVIAGDAAAMPADLRAQEFDHVLTNPPYFDRGTGTVADNPRETSLGETMPPRDWIDAAVRRLAPGGTLTVIQKADRVPDLIAACDRRLGRLRLLPLAARAGRPADRVILRARKGGRAPFRLLPPLVLHAGDAHLRDGDDYQPEIAAILREGRALSVDWG